MTVKTGNGPAPTLVTSVSPAYTCSAPTNPPITAHHGMEAKAFRVGKGWCIMRKTQVKKKVISANDTAEASQGFTTDLLS